MPIDSNIALQVKPLEIPSALDAYGKAMTLRSLVNQGNLQDIQLQDAQRQQQERMTLRDVLKRSGGDMNAVVPELMKAGLPEQALAFQKQVREQQKSDLEIKNLTSQINDRNWKTEKDRTQTFIQAASGPLMKYKELTASGMPDQAARQAVQPLYEQSFVSAFQSGLFDQKHMQGVPAEFDPQWAEGALSQTMTYDKVLADWRSQQTFKQTQKRDALDAANKTLIPDGNGGVQVNEQLVGAKSRIAAAGKPSITVTTEKKYGEQFGSKIAEADVSMRDTALKAPDLAQRANEIRQVLASGKVITGTGADARLAIGKALNLVGANDAETIANTETLATSLARNTLDAIKASGLGAGNGFSNADRDFLEKAVGGKIGLQPQTIDRLATLAHRAAEKSSQRWAERVKNIPANALEGTGVGSESITVPPLFQPGEQRVKSLPDPAQFSGFTATDPASGITYKSDGKSWRRM